MSKKPRRPKTVVPTMKTYDLDSLLGSRGGGFGGGDELDSTMKQVQKMQTDKLKSTMIKKTQIEMEREIQDMQKILNQGGGGAPATITAEEVQFLSQLPEEQRTTAIQAMAAFKAQSGGGNQTGSLGPLLIMSMLQKQPQTGVTELVAALKGMNDIIQTGKPQTKDIDSVVSIARLLLDFKDKDQTALTEVYKELAKERNVDPLQQTESVVNLAKALGMSPAGGINPEVVRIETQSKEMMQQRQHDHELLLKKMDRDDARIETLVNMIAPPLQVLANVFAPGLAAAVGGAAGAGVGASQARRVVEQSGGPKSVKCPCGYEPIWVSEETPVAICPNCGQQVTHPDFKDKTGAQPPGGAPPFSPGFNAPPPPG